MTAQAQASEPLVIEQAAAANEPAGLLVVESAMRGHPWISSLARQAFPGKALLATRSMREASHALKYYACDLVLVDLQLPDGSGIEILEQAARLRPQAQCIVVTVLDDDEHIFASLAAGAKGYLLKDQPSAVLLGQLRQFARGVPALSASVTRRLVEHFSRAPAASPASAASTATPAPPRNDSGAPALSRREKDVLHLLARGQRICGVAAELHISTHTVCSHIKNIYRKLGVSSRAQAALQAQRMGLI